MINHFLPNFLQAEPEFFFFFENTVDPDQIASGEAIWSESTLFFTLVMMIHALKLECCTLTG